MTVPNKENPAKGQRFQDCAQEVLAEYFAKPFCQELGIKIGDPPKEHHFDLVSRDGSVVVECKSYSWTRSGNVPSAKLGFINQALLYLSHLDEKAVPVVALRKAKHESRDETLAEYYCRRYKHLLGSVRVLEIDPDSLEVREYGRDFG